MKYRNKSMSGSVQIDPAESPQKRMIHFRKAPEPFIDAHLPERVQHKVDQFG